MAKESIKNIMMYKIVLPEIVSYSFVYECHRHYACIKSAKLAAQIRLRFEIRNLDKIIQLVVRECVNCTKNARLPFGSVRQDLPKRPVLLRSKAICWNIDVLQIRTGSPEWNKCLLAVDMFSHFLIIAPIIGNCSGLSWSCCLQTSFLR